jgi:hypothetical protein
VVAARSDAGSIPASRRISQTVDGATVIPSEQFAMHPAIPPAAVLPRQAQHHGPDRPQRARSAVVVGDDGYGPRLRSDQGRAKTPKRARDLHGCLSRRIQGELRSTHDGATKVAWGLMLSCITDAAMPVIFSQRPNTRPRWTSQAVGQRAATVVFVLDAHHPGSRPPEWIGSGSGPMSTRYAFHTRH